MASSKNNVLREKVKMYNVSEEQELPGSDKKRTSYPKLRIDTKQLEALKGKSVDDKCDLMITAKVTSKNKNNDFDSDPDDDDGYNFTLEIKEMGFIK